MADEEVDWGVEDVGLGEIANGTEVTQDEDVLSLGGDEPVAPTEPDNKETQPAEVGTAKKAPPTGPRRSFTDSQSAPVPEQASIVPTPSATSRSSPSTGSRAAEPEAGTEQKEDDLPAGWEKLTSRTHGKVFYYKRETNETSWTFPTTQQETPEVKIQPVTEAKQEIKEPGLGPGPGSGPLSNAAAVAPPSKQAPSGPASWRQSNAETDRRSTRPGSRSPPSAPRSSAAVHKRTDDHESDWERNNKRSRMTSPPAGPASSASNRYPARSDGPPRRARSPPAAPSGPSRSGSTFRNGPPSGPRGPPPTAPIRQPTGPGLESNGFDRQRRDIEPPRGPRPENQNPAPAPRFAGGTNTAPLLTNRWGSSSGSATPTPNAPSRSTPTPASGPAAVTSVSAAPDSAADERAKLQEKKRKMQEELDKIQQEEERLEKIETDKKKQKLADEDKVKREADDRRKMDDERRRRDDDRRREMDRRRPDEREDHRRYRPSAGPRSPPPRRAFSPPPRRPLSPPPRRVMSPPPRRPLSPPPLSSRLDPYSRRSPPPRRRSPPPPLARMSSPPSMGGRGDSYRPDRDGPSLMPRDLASRLGGRRSPPPPAFAERMSALPPRPPPRDRPLAERMAPDDRDRRYIPRDRDDRRW